MTTVHGIVPPHLLEALAQNGTEDQDRRIARASLMLDAHTRERRRLTPRGERAPSTQAQSPTVDRAIYDVKHGTELPGTLVRSEGDPPTSDVEVTEAYDGLGGTWRLYWDVFSRNSYDNRGAVLNGCVHYGEKYDNAYFDGTYMVFGDGDGKYFNRFTIDIDIMAHELTHGVTAAESNLEYHDQPGALNESLSDVFGSLVKQYVGSPQPTADQADWLIGADLFTDRVHGVALRSLKAPGTAYDDPVLGKDPQPADMSGYVHTGKDNGGVHINSGIPNHAFYLFATGVGGYAWQQPGHVWYAAMTDPHLSPDADFRAFADLTAAHAQRRYGHECRDACVSAWSKVGITVSGTGADGEGGRVRHVDLTQVSGAAPAAGEPAYRIGPDGTRHVVYRDDDGHLHELSWGR